ncbi:unnamed protein product, partial [Polarella glacialis]
CGWSAFKGFANCCRSCKGPEGPHSHDCAEKNQRLRQACRAGCGRPAFEPHPTCCTRCQGLGSSHTQDCAEKCRAAPVVLDGYAVPAAGGYGGHVAPGRIVDPGAGGYGGHVVPGHVASGGGGYGDHAVAGAAERVRPSGRRRAVLIGVNYRGTRAELRGCHSDVDNIGRLLVERFGWQESCLRRLADDGRQEAPTRRNIEHALHWLVEGARPGDVFFFHFSGHGSQSPDPNGYEDTGMNQTILPVDFQHAGMLTDDQVSEIIVKPLPPGTRLTALLDCCHSGTCLDLPFKLSKSQGWREETNPFHSPGDVQMFSGCTDEGTS